LNLTVIVPALNQAETIGACLASLRGPESFEIFVADGGSDDTTREIALDTGARVWDSPGGLAARCNYAARKSRGDVLFFLGANRVAPADWFQSVAKGLRSPYVVAGGFRGGWRARFGRFATPNEGVFIRRAVWEAVGGLPETDLDPFASLCGSLRACGEFVFV
jgi:glycosyltransferase involved in cell wall biosynthesis